ncbi:hypothetical protein [Hydrogenophaga defluvii]|uniref:Uncharacterized protein n=1 Tax=Hydrogenophaga defluvii TaxID=249410 RepID=A0ABW2SHG1_9BURK
MDKQHNALTRGEGQTAPKNDSAFSKLRAAYALKGQTLLRANQPQSVPHVFCRMTALPRA